MVTYTEAEVLCGTVMILYDHVHQVAMAKHSALLTDSLNVDPGITMQFSWWMQERDLLTLPLKGRSSQTAASTKLRVLKRFDFEPGLMRSGVIAAEPSAPAGTALLFVKGAPSRMKPLLRKATLPEDFQEVCAPPAVTLCCLCP